MSPRSNYFEMVEKTSFQQVFVFYWNSEFLRKQSRPKTAKKEASRRYSFNDTLDEQVGFCVGLRGANERKFFIVYSYPLNQSTYSSPRRRRLYLSRSIVSEPSRVAFSSSPLGSTMKAFPPSALNILSCISKRPYQFPRHDLLYIALKSLTRSSIVL